MTEITLIGKPDCHLCDVAEEIVGSVLAELPDEVADRIELREASIADDPLCTNCGGRRSRSS